MRYELESVDDRLKRISRVKKIRKDLHYNEKRILFILIYKTSLNPYAGEMYKLNAKLCLANETLEEFCYLFKVSESCHFDEEWFSDSIYTKKDIALGWDSNEAINHFIKKLKPYIDPEDIESRIAICGFGNHGIDDMLFRKWFELNGKEKDFNKIFIPFTIDLKGASSVFLMDVADMFDRLTLETAAFAAVRGARMEFMQNSEYRLEMIYRLFYSRFAPTMYPYGRYMTIRKTKENIARFKNTRFYNT